MALCLTDDEIAGLVEGRLDEAAARLAIEHLGGCTACGQLVAAAAPTGAGGPDLDPQRAPGLATGARVGRFVVLALVGKGGMGEVYAAQDPELGRRVALKIVRPDIRASNLQQRLKREAQALAQLNHPEVITVYDVGAIDERVFVAMEFVDGGTLRQWLRAAAHGWREVVDRFLRAGEGLAAAHAAGLVHRDFKPDNVLLGADGRQRVTDFGLARAAVAREPAREVDDSGVPPQPESPLDATLTRPGALVGTPAFMAPEQLDGPADARSDQYAFCASLYQGLYGELPFAGDGLADYMVEVRAGRVRPARQGTKVPKRLRAVILRGLSAEPADRYASMRDLLAALQGQRRRHPVRAWVLASVALAIVASSVAALEWRRARLPWRAELRELGTEYEENSGWVDISPDGKTMAYASDRDGSWRLYVEPLAGGTARPVSPPREADVGDPRWTRDGRGLIYGTKQDGELVVDRLTLADGHVDELARGTDEAEECGDRLLIREPHAPDCQSCARLVTRKDGLEQEIFRGTPASILTTARCDQAGDRVVVLLEDLPKGTTPLHDALWIIGIDGTGLRKVVDDGNGLSYPLFHPDGRSILYTSKHDGAYNIWEQSLSGGEPARLTSGKFDLAPAVSPDGRILVFNSDATPSAMFAWTDGKPQRLTHRLEDVFFAPVATHDGRELILSSWGGISSLVRLRLADGTQTPIGSGSLPALSPDDSVLYFTRRDGDSCDVLAEPLAGGPARTLAHLSHIATQLSFGGDGALHVALSGPQGAEAWLVPLEGSPAREAAAPYRIVLPAPVGGWRVAGIEDGDRHSLELVPPGGTLGAAGNERLPVEPWVWDTNGQSLVGLSESHYVRVGVDGSIQTLAAHGADPFGVAVSPDGKTIYGPLPVAHFRRETIVNYGDRRRPR